MSARVICATHRDLAAEVRAGRFREDLYFRLVVYPIPLPPLRDRADDLPLLVAELLRRSRIARDRGIRAVSPEALTVLGEYRWPGNVRELDNVIQRACLACDGHEIGSHHLPPEIRGSSSRRFNGAGPPSSVRVPRLPPVASIAASVPSPSMSPFSMPPPDQTLREIEHSAVRAALVTCGGNITAAARMLGVSRTKLYRDMKKAR